MTVSMNTRPLHNASFTKSFRGEVVPANFPRRESPADRTALTQLEALRSELEELEVVYSHEEKILWQYMNPKSRPSYTTGLLRDIRRLQLWVEQYGSVEEQPDRLQIRYTVFASRIPGIFNLGGDLPLFVDLIGARDRDGLRAYAHACCDAQYSRIIKFGLPMIGISLVQGDALGGGFECALADDVIIAERSAKFGLPEILFNLFPGMGAYSLLSRRLSPREAEKMILTGRIYTADELHDMGLVDMVADDGAGEDALLSYVARQERSYNAHQAVYRVRQLVNPVTHDELINVTDLWVDAALNLSAPDLRKMQRLATAQDRRFATIAK